MIQRFRTALAKWHGTHDSSKTKNLALHLNRPIVRVNEGVWLLGGSRGNVPFPGRIALMFFLSILPIGFPLTTTMRA